MVVVLARLFVKPERQADFVARAQEVIAATREEKGCVSYTLYKSTEDPLEFIYVEEWESRADLDAHAKSAHLVAFKKDRADMMAKDSIVKTHEVVK